MGWNSYRVPEGAHFLASFFRWVRATTCQRPCGLHTTCTYTTQRGWTDWLRELSYPGEQTSPVLSPSPQSLQHDSILWQYNSVHKLTKYTPENLPSKSRRAGVAQYSDYATGWKSGLQFPAGERKVPFPFPTASGPVPRPTHASI
jgi:hypothetical protein